MVAQQNYTPTEHEQYLFSVFTWTQKIPSFISCFPLLYIIVDIIRKKKYIHTNIKLFLFACIFHLLLFLTVVLHTTYAFGKEHIMKVDGQIKFQFQNNLQRTLCGSEAFLIQLTQDLTYFFVLLMLLNINQILSEMYAGFMKRTFTNPKVIIFLTLMVFFLLVPWIFIYIDEMNSYLPIGIQLDGTLYLLFCGFTIYQGGFVKIILLVFTFLPLVSLLILQFAAILIIYQKIRVLRDPECLNSRQKFIVYVYKLSIIFAIMNSIALANIVLQYNFNEGYVPLIWVCLYLFSFLILYYYKNSLGISYNKIFQQSLSSSDCLTE